MLTKKMKSMGCQRLAYCVVVSVWGVCVYTHKYTVYLGANTLTIILDL